MRSRCTSVERGTDRQWFPTTCSAGSSSPCLFWEVGRAASKAVEDAGTAWAGEKAGSQPFLPASAVNVSSARCKSAHQRLFKDACDAVKLGIARRLSRRVSIHNVPQVQDERQGRLVRPQRRQRGCVAGGQGGVEVGSNASGGAPTSRRRLQAPCSAHPAACRAPPGSAAAGPRCLLWAGRHTGHQQ